MKTSLLSALLVSTVMLSMDAHANFFSRIFSNPAQKHIDKVKDVYSGVSFSYLDRKDRLLIVNDFLASVELEYSLLPLKAERIGLDFNKMKEEAIADENAVEDILLSAKDRKDEDLREKFTFLQAKSNMEFLDRMQALVAKFKDTHFGIQEKIARPMIYNGLRLFRIQNKIVVGSLETKFLAMAGKVSGTDFSPIRVGDEVLAIDGVPVEEKIKEMKKFIGSSSEGFLDSEAVRSLTIRNFNYEKKNSVKVTFKMAGTYKFPVFANIVQGQTPRLDALAYFKKIGIPSDTTTIGMTFDKTTNKWTDSALRFDGYSTRRLHLNLKGVTEMAGDDGTPAIRTGYYMSKGKTYGVLQLLTFSTRNVKVGEAEPVSFLDAIRSFVAELKDNELPLILDLRINGGGNASYPRAVLSILTEGKAVYASDNFGMRMNHYTRQLEEPALFQQIPGEDVTEGIPLEDYQAMIQDTLENHLEYAPMYNFGPIEADSKVRGFNNKIVALVTPDCISACDMMSFLLKSSKRATIIGTHSNGTGAGYSTSSELNTQWEDRLRVLSTQIPNFLFGLPGNSPDTRIFEADSVSKLCTENLPTVADIPYSSTMVDLTKNNLGWLQKAVEVLETKK